MAIEQTNHPVFNKVIMYLERKPILGLIHLDSLYRKVAGEVRNDRVVYSHFSRTSIGHNSAIRSPHNTFYAIYLQLLDESDEKHYLALPGIPRSIIKLEDPSCTAINELKESLREKYGADHVDFWLQAGQNHTVRIAARAMRTARKRDKGRCILCQHVNNLRRKEGLEAIRSRSSRRMSSHVISRKSVFWNEVARIDSDHDLFSTDGTTALFTSLKENVFISDPGHIVMLCHDHDQLLIRTIRDFAKGLA